MDATDTSNSLQTGTLWAKRGERCICAKLYFFLLPSYLALTGLATVAGLAQSVGRLTAEREVAGSIPGAGPLLKVLKWLRNEGTSFALQAARPSRGSDDHVKWRSRLH